MSTEEVSSDTVESLEEATPASQRGTSTLGGPAEQTSPVVANDETDNGSNDDSLLPEPDDNPNSIANRFRPSGMTHKDYSETLIRRWESYQVSTVRKALAKLGITNASELDISAKVPIVQQKIAQLVGTTLVKPFKPGTSPQLHRRGAPGLARLKKDVSADELLAAFKVACELSGVFE